MIKLVLEYLFVFFLREIRHKLEDKVNDVENQQCNADRNTSRYVALILTVVSDFKNDSHFEVDFF